MPRIREDVIDETPVDDTAVETPEATPERSARAARRPAPVGVTLGMAEAPVPVEAPSGGVSGGKRGKPTSQKALDLIAACKANPGQWFLVGEFLSPQNPQKTSALGSAGLVFSNERRDHNGTVTFVRKACLPIVAEG